MAEFEGLRQFFGDGEAITYEQLAQGIASKGMKLADLSQGGYVSREKYDKQTRDFDDYKSKNDASRYADYDAIVQERDALLAEKADREMLGHIADKKVRPEFQRFVLAEVKAKVTEDTTFEKALEDYLKTNPQYLQAEEKPPFFRGSSVPLDGGGGGTKTTNERMNARFRSARK